MKYHRGEPGVVYPEGGTWLDSADDDDKDAVVEFWRKKMEKMGIAGRWTVAAVPAPLQGDSRSAAWSIRIWKENDESPEVES